MIGLENKLALYGFNNLTKALSFNIYDVCYAKSAREQRDYIAYIDEQYNSNRLTQILLNVTDIIGATVLNISKQDYEPQGASVNVLIAEQPVSSDSIDLSCNQGRFLATPASEKNSEAPENTAKTDGAKATGPKNVAESPKKQTPKGSAVPQLLHGHLDKSHVTVHTFPESHPDNSISTFRVDIDVATCGTVSPVNTLDYLISSFDSDIITIDYRVRGFTRDINGKKFFIDHPITSIQDFINPRTLNRYDAIDVNVYQSNLFHTKMLIKEIELQRYLFNTDVYELPPQTRLEIANNLRKEMIEIFSGTNIY